MEKWTTCLRSFHADGQITAPLLYSQRNKLVQGIFRSRDALMAEKKWDGYSPASANRLLLYISPYVTTWELWSGKQCPNNCRRPRKAQERRLNSDCTQCERHGILKGYVKDVRELWCRMSHKDTGMEWNELSPSLPLGVPGMERNRGMELGTSLYVSPRSPSPSTVRTHWRLAERSVAVRTLRSSVRVRTVYKKRKEEPAATSLNTVPLRDKKEIVPN